MCTALTLSNGDFYFGRNLDLEYPFGQQVVVTPRAYPLSFHCLPPLPRHYAMIGMAGAGTDYPFYAEAANEKGLCMAGLYFPGNAYYHPQPQPDALNAAPYELIPWLLGQCASVAEARPLLERLALLGVPFREDLPLAPLHWILADREDCLVIEPTREGVKLYHNPAGVLTNNPPFPYHLDHLTGYLHLSPRPQENRLCPHLPLQPYGQGLGAVGLPGDFSPASRFVRAAFLRLNSVCPKEEGPSVAQFFHILDAVAMVRGSVVTPEGRCDLTLYSCCINATRGIYYYKAYDDTAVTALALDLSLIHI